MKDWLSGLVCGVLLCGFVIFGSQSLKQSWEHINSAAAPEAAPIPEPWPSEPPPAPPEIIPIEKQIFTIMGPSDVVHHGPTLQWKPCGSRQCLLCDALAQYMPEPPHDHDGELVPERDDSDAEEITNAMRAVVSSTALDPAERDQLIYDLVRDRITPSKALQRVAEAEGLKPLDPPKPDERRPDPVAVSKPDPSALGKKSPFYISSVPVDGEINITLGESSRWVSIDHAREVCRSLLRLTAVAN